MADKDADKDGDYLVVVKNGYRVKTPAGMDLSSSQGGGGGGQEEQRAAQGRYFQQEISHVRQNQIYSVYCARTSFRGCPLASAR